MIRKNPFLEGATDPCRDDVRGVIISPAALGDDILMLPLACFMKERLGLTRVDFIGRTDYIHFYPGRTCVDSIRSVDLIDFHRLFVDEKDFTLDDKDPLITAFSRYEWIVSFLGAGSEHFESNLIFTVNCSHSAEIVMLPLLPGEGFNGHISEFYLHGLAESALHLSEGPTFDPRQVLVHPREDDDWRGRDLLASRGVAEYAEIVMIHPGSGGTQKCWHLSNYLSLAALLADQGYEVVFLLGPVEQERFSPESIQQLEATGKIVGGLNTSELVQTLSQAKLYVGNDSGVSHLAGAMGLPAIALFGPTDPRRFGPLGPTVTVIQDDPAAFQRPQPKSVQRVLDRIGALLHD